MNYLGIDPGKTGGMSLLDEHGELVYHCRTPMLGKEYDERDMAEHLSHAGGGCLAVIEKVGAFPGQGVTAMFNFGMGWGLWRGMMAAQHIRYEMVLPRNWQTIVSFPAGLPKPERKKAIIAWARRQWPLIPNHSGVCEAACMAEWLRRREVGA